MIKKFFFILSFIFFSTYSLAVDKFVIVDVQFLIKNSSAGKSIEKKIQSLDKKNIDLFKKKEKALSEKEKKIISQKNVTSEEEYKKKVSVFRKDLEKYNLEKRDLIEKSRKEKEIMLKKLLKDINDILLSYADKNDISFVLDKKNLILSKKDHDITEKILNILNKKN